VGYGEWSNIEFTLVGYFFDDFSNPASGWRIASHPLYTLGYINGWYRIYVPLDFRGAAVWIHGSINRQCLRRSSARRSPYCVSVYTYFASEPGWWSNTA